MPGSLLLGASLAPGHNASRWWPSSSCRGFCPQEVAVMVVLRLGSCSRSGGVVDLASMLLGGAGWLALPRSRSIGRMAVA